jgi:hypothetical protein
MHDLPENIFPINLSDLPGEDQCDARGELLLFSPNGWLISHLEDLKDTIQDYNCSYWTFLPPDPF